MNPQDHPADEPPSPEQTTIQGARWAINLGAALLVAFTLLTAARWLGKPATAAEEIVQTRPDQAPPKPTPPPELLAPDPGDHP